MFEDDAGLRKQPLGELIARLLEQVGALWQTEAALAQQEVRGKLRAFAFAAAFAAAAGLFVLLGFIALLITAIVLLQLVAPLWAAALIVTVVAFALAAMFALTAQSIAAKAAPLVPARTLKSLKEDARWLKIRLLSKSV